MQFADTVIKAAAPHNHSLRLKTSAKRWLPTADSKDPEADRSWVHRSTCIAGRSQKQVVLLRQPVKKVHHVDRIAAFAKHAEPTIVDGLNHSGAIEIR